MGPLIQEAFKIGSKMTINCTNRLNPGGDERYSFWPSFVLLLPLHLLLLAGCGSSGPFDIQPVSGKVIYDDGTPAPGGYRLVFISQATPVDGKYFARPASAEVEGDGVFHQVTSHKYGDGLIRGKHKVFFNFQNTDIGPTVVAKEYWSKHSTPLEIDTKDAPLEIRIPKPVQSP